MSRDDGEPHGVQKWHEGPPQPRVAPSLSPWEVAPTVLPHPRLTAEEFRALADRLLGTERAEAALRDRQ